MNRNPAHFSGAHAKHDGVQFLGAILPVRQELPEEDVEEDAALDRARVGCGHVRCFAQRRWARYAELRLGAAFFGAPRAPRMTLEGWMDLFTVRNRNFKGNELACPYVRSDS